MNESTAGIDRLIQLIQQLRSKNGCPWDRKQTPKTMALYLAEEVFELSGAIEEGDPARVCEELGDVLFQVLFIAWLFTETSSFGMGDVTDRIIEKMIRRHPHVFGDEEMKTTEEIRTRWHEIKKEESKNDAKASILSSIPGKMPALMKAYRISERAARSGFDWNDMNGVLEKSEEEWAEFNQELQDINDTERKTAAELEFGDLLFTLVNVARWAGFHPETALSRATQKFQTRFEFMEKEITAGGREVETVDREELDRRWEDAKKACS